MNRAPFLSCKQEIGQNNFSSMEYIKSTKTTPKPQITSEKSWTRRTTFSYKSVFTKDNTTSHSIATTYAHFFLKSRRNKATIAGASIAGILALTFFVLLVVCLLKRRRFQRLQAEQQTNQHHLRWPCCYKSEAGRQSYIHYSFIGQSSKLVMNTIIHKLSI